MSPGVTRAFEADRDGFEVLVIGPHVEGDAEIVDDFWSIEAVRAQRPGAADGRSPSQMLIRRRAPPSPGVQRPMFGADADADVARQMFARFSQSPGYTNTATDRRAPSAPAPTRTQGQARNQSGLLSVRTGGSSRFRRWRGVDRMTSGFTKRGTSSRDRRPRRGYCSGPATSEAAAPTWPPRGIFAEADATRSR